MKILILNYEFPPLGGGAGNGSYNLARELVRAGHQVDVLTSRAPGQAAHETLSGIQVIRVASWRKGIHDSGLRGAFTYLFFACPVFMRMTLRERYEVIHYFFSLPTGLMALLPGPHRRVPYLVSLRGSDVPGYDPFNRRLQKLHRLMLPVTRRIWRGALKVVALSSNLRATAMETDHSVDFAVVPNGVDAELFNSGPRQSVSAFRIVAVARLIERKGIQHILTALSEMEEKDIELTVVGEGNYADELTRYCRRLGLEERVNFYGYCPREQLPQLLATQDLFVLPSMAEAFGQVYVEAMSCGMPVVGGRTGGVVDIVGPENGILVEPGSVEEIKQAIGALYHDRVRCRAMGARNRDRVLKHYSWRSVAQQYGEMYQSCRVRGAPALE